MIISLLKKESIRRSCGRVALLGLPLVAASCQSPSVKLTPAQEAIRAVIDQIDPADYREPGNTAIVDIHTHTFNARYLPLRGVLLGKRDAKAPLTAFITDNCAMNVAQEIVNLTELAPLNGPDGIVPRRDTADVRATGSPGFICKIFLGIIDDAAKEGVWEPSLSPEDRLKALNRMAAKMGPLQKLAVVAASEMMGTQEHTRGGKESPETINGYQSFLQFLWILTQNDRDIPEIYRRLHKDVAMKGPITMVSHMMDLGPVYDQKKGEMALLDFKTEQVARMEKYQNAPNSNLYYFVAYNPYRDFLPNAGKDDALDLVKDAVLNHGAKGVKIYPPSGYRAAGNEILPRPCTLLTEYPGKQWDARYGRMEGDKNKVLDAELNRVLDWCVKDDVPVLVHSGYGEFEARKGYGVHNSNPEFWEKFLESHSTPGNPCRLRLCLGHAGGEDYWMGTGEHADWGRRVFALCTKYPNVYCEITTSERMIDSASRAYLVSTLRDLFELSPPGDNHFAKKLLYGTDWPLPDQGRPDVVLRSTQRAFLHPALISHYADYFSGNAYRFLKIPAP